MTHFFRLCVIMFFVDDYVNDVDDDGSVGDGGSGGGGGGGGGDFF